MKITKREYNAALKIVETYNKQERERTKPKSKLQDYGFIWYDSRLEYHDVWVRAWNLHDTCAKFLHKDRKTMVSVDQEVQVGRASDTLTWIDISDRGEFANYF